MKIRALLCLLSASALSAADVAFPSFSERLTDHPQLSLSQAVKSGQLPTFDPQAKVTAEKSRRASAGQKLVVSRMPIIEPSADVDRAMPIVAPTSDVDFKMMMKVPKVDSVK